LAADTVLAVSYASKGDTSNDTQPSTPFDWLWTGWNKAAARVRSSSANSKKSASPDFPRVNFSRIEASYAVLFLMAWSKIVGFDVKPVTDRSRM
jgi:hypothetical protein